MNLSYRMKAAAKAHDLSESYMWWLAKNDPDFPQLIKLGKKCTLVRADDLAAYFEKKAQQSAGRNLATA